MHDRKKSELISRSPRETAKVAEDIARILRKGDIVYLYGELGSGKTVFVKGVCSALGVREEVTSPSFVIATEYHGTMKIVHIDLYRLPCGQVDDLPIEEYIADNGVTLIEWADRIEVGEQGIKIRLSIMDHEQRGIEIEDFRD